MQGEFAISVSHITKQFHSIQVNYALTDISFQLRKGAVLGLIGDNGAGKSTLLRIICGLTKPDSGTVSYKGRLSYILDIGSCFHPDLSGIDNIFLAGRINGYSKAQIDEKLDSIIEFSELGNFMHTPLKYYSNGMYLRLAFTTNTSFYSEILLLDEITSVGDLHFQQKAKERIKEIVSNGTTVIMTGHDIERLNNLCTHGLWLASGKQVFLGEITETVDKYLSFTENNSGRPGSEKKVQSITTYVQHINSPERSETDEIIMLEAGIRPVGKSFDHDLYMNDELEIEVYYRKSVDIPVVLFAVIQDKFGHNLMSLCSHRLSDESKFIDNAQAGSYRQYAKLPGGIFNHGVFSVSFYFTNSEEAEIATFKRMLFFKINKSDHSFGIFNYKGNFPGTLLPFSSWTTFKES